MGTTHALVGMLLAVPVAVGSAGTPSVTEAVALLLGGSTPYAVLCKPLADLTAAVAASPVSQVPAALTGDIPERSHGEAVGVRHRIPPSHGRSGRERPDRA